LDIFKSPLIIFAFGILAGILLLLIIRPEAKCDPVVFESNQGCIEGSDIATSSAKNMMVDVSGAVSNPGVYKLPEGSRVSDAVSAAGGLAEDKVNKELVSQGVNLAQIVHDGEKIYIPFQSDSLPISHSGSVISATDAAGMVSINNATFSELVSLPDIGEVRAKKIIDNRPYSKIEDLVEQKIIFQSTFDKIKDKIVL